MYVSAPTWENDVAVPGSIVVSVSLSSGFLLCRLSAVPCLSFFLKGGGGSLSAGDGDGGPAEEIKSQPIQDRKEEENRKKGKTR